MVLVYECTHFLSYLSYSSNLKAIPQNLTLMSWEMRGESMRAHGLTWFAGRRAYEKKHTTYT